MPVTIDGDASYVIDTDYGGVTIHNNGTGNYNVINSPQSGATVGNAFVRYEQVTTSPYNIDEDDLKVGINIYGVLYSGDATVNLPSISDPRKIVVVKNEGDSSNSSVSVIGA